MKTFSTVLLCMYVAFQVFSMDSQKPLFSVSKVKNSPLIDGVINDECWKSAGGTNEFIIYENGNMFYPRLSSDGTLVKAVIDDKHLYIAAEMFHEFLFTASNQLFRFKSNIKEHDGPVSTDDALEIFIKPNALDKRTYQLIINSLGTVYDAVLANGKRDKTWNSNIIAKAKILEGKWTLEVAIPLNLFCKNTLKRDETIQICFARRVPYSNSLSSWPACDKHFGDRFGEIMIKDSTLFIDMKSTPTIQSGGNSYTFNVNSEKRKKYLFNLELQNGKSTFFIKKNVSVSPNEKPFEVNFEINEMLPKLMFYSLIDRKSNNAIYVSPRFALSERKENKKFMFFAEDSETLFYIGDKKVEKKDGVGEAEILPENKINELKIIFPGKNTTGYILVDGEKYPFDNSWEKTQKGEGFCLRKTILTDYSLLWPANTEEKIFIPDEAVSPFFFFPQGVAGRKIKNYTLYFEIPEGFELLGPNVYQKNIKVSTVKERKVVQGNTYNRYLIKFNNSIIHRSKDYWSNYRTNLHFALKASSSNKGTAEKFIYWGVYGDGITEIQRKIKIISLPTLNGKRWKKLIFLMWGGIFYSGTDLPYAENMLKAFANMGCTETMMLAREFNPLYDQVLELPEKLGMKAIRTIPDWKYTFGEEEILKDNPEMLRITISGGKAGHSFWGICPQFLINDTALRLKMIDNLKKYLTLRKNVLKGFVLDIEHLDRGLTCYCDRCIKNFEKEYNISEILDKNDLKNKYEHKWIDFSAEMVSKRIEVIRDIINQCDPSITLYVYSAYERPGIKRIHGTDWKRWAPYIDVASCGYGRQLKNTKKTLECLTPYNVPLLGGVIVDNYKRSSRKSVTQINGYQLMSRLIDCRGGILAYSNASGFDGRTYHNIAEFTRFVADYEDMFINRKLDNDFIKCDFPEEDKLVLTGKNIKLIILLNGKNEAKYFSIDFKTPASGFDYYSTRKYENIKNLQGEIKPRSFKAWIFHVD